MTSHPDPAIDRAPGAEWHPTPASTAAHLRRAATDRRRQANQLERIASHGPDRPDLDRRAAALHHEADILEAGANRLDPQ